VHLAVLRLARIDVFLTCALVRADAGHFIFLGAGVEEYSRPVARPADMQKARNGSKDSIRYALSFPVRT
jgi:hypothetical protein